MAKYINISYALLCIVSATSACSQEDAGRGADRDTGVRIEFNASMPEVSSRATEVKAETLKDIEVSAFTIGASSETPYFINKTFGKNGNTGKFVCYDPQCIWPNNNDLLKFAAFAPSYDEIRASGGNVSSTGDKLTDFQIAHDIATQFDFVTAIATGRLIENEETGITLKFRHQLSRIELKAWGNSASYDLEIAGVRLGGIGTGGTFNFKSQTGATEPTQAGVWESVTKGNVEYIFHDGDAIVTIDKKNNSPLSADKAISIMGSKFGSDENSAMIVPSNNSAWNFKTNATNGSKNADGMYFSVLVRITDTTPYDTKGSIVYPYEGAEYEEEKIYLAVDKTDGKTVKTRLYKRGGGYFTEADHSTEYDLSANNAEVKAFGWAALPVSDNLDPGRVYTYTLNYSNGVGIRDPHDIRPGEPVISDKVLVNVEVTDWIEGPKTDVSVPRK